MSAPEHECVNVFPFGPSANTLVPDPQIPNHSASAPLATPRGPCAEPFSPDQNALLIEFRSLLVSMELRLSQRLEQLINPHSESEPMFGGRGDFSPRNSASEGAEQRPQRTETPDLNALTPQTSISPASGVQSSAAAALQSILNLNPSPHGHTYSQEDLANMTAARQVAVSVLRPGGFVSEAPRPKTSLERVISSPMFEAVFGILIVLSSLSLGVEVEYMAQHRGDPRPVPFLVLDVLFAICFLFELVLRLSSSRCNLFRRDMLLWNCFDLILVVVSLLDIGVEIFVQLNVVSGTDIKGLNNLRLVRVLRVTRAVRTLRIARLIRFVASLRTLVASIMATLQSLVWALLLLLLFDYSVAIVFTEATNDYLAKVGGDPALEEFWGNLTLAMFTLYESISGGVSWHDVVEPLKQISLGLVALFAFYIFLTTFAVLNVLTGVFCQSAIDLVSRDPDLKAQSLIDQRRDYLENAQRLFDRIDVKKKGQIDFVQLEGMFSDANSQGYLAAMGVQEADAWSLFKLIDVDRNHGIDKEEFVSGMLRLQGQARSLDVQALRHNQEWLSRRLARLSRRETGTSSQTRA